MIKLALSILFSITACSLLMVILNNTSQKLFAVFVGVLIGITISYLVPESLINKIDDNVKKFIKRIV